MPDPTYKTFLSPGSCQLEITDLVAAANDDTGVDLYGVAWEIEQVLIAGEGFAASPTDVWVNERGIFNVGQSLFDKINRTAEDNDNIPGQCTVIVKATSLVDSSKVARLKVLVGYPGGGGGGGGGASVGALQERMYIFDSKPSVNDEFSAFQEQLMPDAVMVGDSVVVVGNCAMLAADSWGILAEIEEESRPTAFKFKVDVGASLAVIDAIEDVTLDWESVTFDGYASSAFQMPDITGYYLGVVIPQI